MSRSAAVSGVLFALLHGAALVLVRLSVPGATTERRDWLARDASTLAPTLHLLAYAGIAFTDSNRCERAARPRASPRLQRCGPRQARGSNCEGHSAADGPHGPQMRPMRPMRPKMLGPARWRALGNIGAGEKSRTPDLRITNALLYQLSYTGAGKTRIVAARRGHNGRGTASCRRAL
jgi:hypothetical protein